MLTGTFLFNPISLDQGQCSEDVTDTVIGPVTWPSTQSGLVIESFERCPLHTEKGEYSFPLLVTHPSIDSGHSPLRNRHKKP